MQGRRICTRKAEFNNLKLLLLEGVLKKGGGGEGGQGRTGEGLALLHRDPSLLLEKEQEQAGILVKEHQAREEKKREIAMEKRR